ALLVLPAASPGARHRNEGLVGVVIVHHRTIAGFGAAIAEIETFGNLDRCKARGIVADRGGHGPALAWRRLKADDVIEFANAALHLAVGQPAIGTLEILEPRDTFHHFGPGQTGTRQGFHWTLLLFLAETIDHRSGRSSRDDHAD